jgi:predicted P-loop ATPase
MLNNSKKTSKKQANSSSAAEQDQTNENKVTRLEGYLKKKYEFRYNEVTKDTEYRQNDDKFQPLDERLTAALRIELHKQGFSGCKGLLDDLLHSPCFAPNFNPFKVYFESLPKWNGNDYIGELTDHVGLKDSSQREWFRKMFRKHLMRTVACALRILPFNKQCFVLLGKQNDGKSYFVRFLCPSALLEYYKENPPLDHKDGVIALSQNLIINLDELSSMDKVEANKIKSLFSQTDTKIRGHYAEKDSLQQRYASFFGTTNEPEFLNDVTGNVRWLIFEIDGIEHDHGGPRGYAKRINIDNVWAQAYSLVEAGEAYELTPDETRELEKANRKYQRSTIEMDMVDRYFSESEKGKPNTFALSASDVLMAIQKVMDVPVRLTHTNIGRALSALKIEKRSIRMPYQNPIHRYILTSDNEQILDYLHSLPGYLAI